MNRSGFVPRGLVDTLDEPEREGRVVHEGNELRRSVEENDIEEVIDSVPVSEFYRDEPVATDGAALLAVEPVANIVALGLSFGLPILGMALVDLGEEYLIKNSFSASYNSGLYDTGTDTLGETSDIGGVTSEPGGSNYSRQSTPTTADDFSGDWGVDNDNQESFDLSDTGSGTIDGWFWETSFTAVDTGDGSSTSHLILFGSLSQSYDLGSVDTLNISAGSMQFSVS